MEKVDLQIQELINEDIELKRLFKLTTSVKGIGKVTATQIIVDTNEFKSISEAKKFACYAGVVPFEHSSGTSVNGRSHVSNMAVINAVRNKLIHRVFACVRDKRLYQPILT